MYLSCKGINALTGSARAVSHPVGMLSCHDSALERRIVVVDRESSARFANKTLVDILSDGHFAMSVRRSARSFFPTAVLESTLPPRGT